MSAITQAVTFNIEAAHRSPTNSQMHGHSYVVELWVRALFDFAFLQAQVEAIKQTLDHTVLNESMGGSSMEEMAAWILARAAPLSPVRVVISRPSLGFKVEALA